MMPMRSVWVRRQRHASCVTTQPRLPPRYLIATATTFSLATIVVSTIIASGTLLWTGTGTTESYFQGKCCYWCDHHGVNLKSYIAVERCLGILRDMCRHSRRGIFFKQHMRFRSQPSFFSIGGFHSSTCKWTMHFISLSIRILLFVLLVIAGDVERNPGPPKRSEENQWSHVADFELTEGDVYDIYEEVISTAADWKQMAIGLRIPLETRDRIAKENQNDSKECLLAVLSHWVKKAYDFQKYGHPSWRFLVMAVDSPIGGHNRELAKIIAKKNPASKSTVVSSDVEECRREITNVSPETTGSQSDVVSNKKSVSRVLPERYKYQLRRILHKDSKKLVMQFFQLSTNTLDSLDTEGTSVKRLKKYVSRFPLLTTKGSPTLADEVEPAQNVYDVISILEKKRYITFYKFTILESIIERFCIDSDGRLSKELKQYKEQFKIYIRRRVCESFLYYHGLFNPGEEYTPKEGCNLVLITDDNWNHESSLEAVLDLEGEVADIFGIQDFAFSLEAIEESCLRLYHSISSSVEHVILSLKHEQVLKLKRHGIAAVHCGDCHIVLETYNRITIEWPNTVEGDDEKRTWTARSATSVDSDREKTVAEQLRNTDGWTALHSASQKGNMSAVKVLLQKGADISIRNEAGQTPLMIASFHGHAGVSRVLIEEGHAHVNARNKNGRTALHLASGEGNMSVVKVLLEKGADLSIRNEAGQTPLMIASFHGHVDVVRVLIEEGHAHVNARNKNGRTALHLASGEGNMSVVKVLLERGADISIRDEDWQTPLMTASFHGHVDVVHVLIEEGHAHVNAQNMNGRTALHLASQKGSVSVVKVLLQKGADISIRNEDGHTPLMTASDWGRVDVVRVLIGEGHAHVNAQDKNGWTALHLASQQGDISVVKVLLQKGADISIRNEDEHTPLMTASDWGLVDVVRVLIEEGHAHVNAQDKNGWTALHLASQKGNMSVVKVLLQKGADISIRNEDGHTPLMTASDWGRVDVVRVLIEEGHAHVNAQDKCGQTALHLAISAIEDFDVDEDDYVPVVKLLLHKGADVSISDEYGDTPLMVARQRGYDKIYSVLTETHTQQTILKKQREPASGKSEHISGEKRLKVTGEHTPPWSKYTGTEQGKLRMESPREEMWNNVANYVLTEGDVYDVFDEVHTLAFNWRGLARSLRLPSTVVQCADAGHGGVPVKCLFNVLKQWLQRSYNSTLHGYPSWRMLVNAVASPTGGGNVALAKAIAQKHQAGVPSSTVAGAYAAPSTHSKEGAMASEEPLLLSTEFTKLLLTMWNLLSHCTTVGNLKTFLQFFTHPLYPEKCYVEPHVYKNAKSVKDMLLNLFPGYINYREHHLLKVIVNKFGNDECRDHYRQYNVLFQRTMRKLRHHPAPITDDEIEQSRGQKRLKVTTPGDARATTPHDLHTVQEAIN